MPLPKRKPFPSEDVATGKKLIKIETFRERLNNSAAPFAFNPKLLPPLSKLTRKIIFIFDYAKIMRTNFRLARKLDASEDEKKSQAVPSVSSKSPSKLSKKKGKLIKKRKLVKIP